jgi:WS/DGAT/MGAT family acyltransferase
MLDLEREPAADPGPLPPVPDTRVLGPVERTADAVGHVLRRNLGIARRTGSTVLGAATGAVTDPVGAVRQLGEGATSIGRMLAPATEPMSPLLRQRSLSVRFETLTFPLADLKAAAKAAGGTLNDAFVAGVAGGLRRYHDAHGAPVERLRMNMPINIRDETTQHVAGNQFAPARFPVPLTPEDPVELMRTIHGIVDSQRHEPSLSLIAPMAGVLNRLPTTLTTAVFGSMLKGVDFTTSNVPGAPVPVFLAGGRVDAMFPFGPLAGAAVNITLLSHCDQVHLGVNTDAAAVPDPDLLLECLRESFDELLKLA